MRSAQKNHTRDLGRLVIALFFAVFLAACADLRKPAAEPFVAITTPPPKQEFRWYNGKLPKSFDPARAAAAPETDVARAIYEGLTDIDPQTLEARPAIAEKWSSDDHRVWTFHLRKEARWSNGKRVTAGDVVSSWKRLVRLGGKVAHPHLFQNIVGFKQPLPAADTLPEEFDPVVRDPALDAANGLRAVPAAPAGSAPTSAQTVPNGDSQTKIPEKKLGLEVIDEATLKVTLEVPDKDFPRLVADPIFFPIYGDGAEFDTEPLSASIITNGAFKITLVGKDAVYLERSASYWNKAAVGLERVRLIAMENAETALTAYKKGEIDAVTNAGFEPLALKLLTPYEDFRKTRHGAVNLYEINMANAPFSDRRVRQALAMSIDRERLVEKDLEGAAEPALNIIPFGSADVKRLSYDIRTARELLEKAGYPAGEGFPEIRLVVNRNDTQARIARTVARMWKEELNLNTSIIVKESAEIDAVRQAGEYDVIRRGFVLPTLDEMVSLTTVFGTPRDVKPIVDPPAENTGAEPRGPVADAATDSVPPETPAEPRVATEAGAMLEFGVIPLYFPVSYSLVKPYVRGFELNAIGAPPLKYVSIDNAWQPPRGD